MTISRIPGERSGWKVLLLFAAGTGLLYFPVLSNGFLTDDYASLYRLLIEKRILYQELLRPLIDISFYLNYLVTGLHPLGYYLFNFSVHALVCFMVYRVALDLPLFPADRREVFALTAGFLFLFYPFHNEGIVWLSGRLSSMAALCGLLAIHFSLTRAGGRGFLLAAAFWFIGLFAYESILVLPAMILLFEWMKYRDGGRLVRGAGAWAVAGLLWLVMRYFLAGGLFPDYMKGGVESEGTASRLMKVLGRCFLPPMEDRRLMIGSFVVGMVLIGLLYFRYWRRRPGLEVIFLLSLMPAIAFGVSTRTSEGDRLFYFPSCIFCMLISAWLCTLASVRQRLLLCAGLAVAGAVLIEGNNRHWVIASRTASAMIDSVRAAPARVVLVNAPDEWEGAFIFRNNFQTGLTVNGIDTNKVVAPHFLMRLEYLPVKGRIQPLRKDSGVFLYPATWITAADGRFRIKGVPGSFDFVEDRIYYWDRSGWKRLILGQQ